MSDDQSNNQNDVLSRQLGGEALLARENQELRARLAALQNNVTEGNFRGETPRYYLNEAAYIDDQLFPAGTTIECWETPDHGTWVPQNEAAMQQMRERLEHVEYGARLKAALAGRPYLGLPTDRAEQIAAAAQDARADARAEPQQFAMPVKRPAVIPPMAHQEAQLIAGRRPPGRPRKVVAEVAPEQSRAGGTDMGAPPLAPVVVGRS